KSGGKHTGYRSEARDRASLIQRRTLSRGQCKLSRCQRPRLIDICEHYHLDRVVSNGGNVGQHVFREVVLNRKLPLLYVRRSLVAWNVERDVVWQWSRISLLRRSKAPGKVVPAAKPAGDVGCILDDCRASDLRKVGRQQIRAPEPVEVDVADSIP